MQGLIIWSKTLEMNDDDDVYEAHLAIAASIWYERLTARH
jgi:hypothetical protein